MIALKISGSGVVTSGTTLSIKVVRVRRAIRTSGSVPRLRGSTAAVTGTASPTTVASRTVAGTTPAAAGTASVFVY